VEDLAGYAAGDPLHLALRDTTVSGRAFTVRYYQRQAAEAFHRAGSERGGSGVVVLPCGAGKTVVGLAAMELVGQTALVLTTSMTSVKQWRREILDKTTLRPDDIAEYTGDQKNTGPVTLATYQILTWRENRESEFPHLELFRARSWA
jgi:DNA excision repair protein ERCC-3